MAPTAQSLLMAATGHAASAKILLDAVEVNLDNGICAASMWFLMGWATELSLKAAILHFGGSEKDCKEAGHDLNIALTTAMARGYVSKLKNLSHLVRDLSLSHQSHYFRYMPADDIEVPGDASLVLSVIIKLIVEINMQIG